MKLGNDSQAVVNRRQLPLTGLEDFPTQPWGTRALCERLGALSMHTGMWTVWEPACGNGFMARPLAEYFGAVWATDLAAYPGQQRLDEQGINAWGQVDFLSDDAAIGLAPDAIITNPPFRLAQQFVWRALNLVDSRKSGGLVCMLCRSNFSESIGRWEGLFSQRRPRWVFQFVERLPMRQGICDHEATTATAYAWFVWCNRSAQFTIYDWIAPCRKALEKIDYDYSFEGGSKWTGSQQDISQAR